MDADGSGQTNLTLSFSNDSAPAFSPDGRQIVFHTDRDGDLDVYRMQTSGALQTRLSNDIEIDA